MYRYTYISFSNRHFRRLHNLTTKTMSPVVEKGVSAIKKVVIGGGTGFVGQRLGSLLRSSGYQVVNVSRMPNINNISWTTVQNIGLPDDVWAVVNCAGQPFMDFSKRWTPGFKQNVVNSRVVTTATLCEAINKAGCKPKAFILISGVGAYEPSETAVYDESSPTTGNDFFSNLTKEMEKAAATVQCIRQVTIRSGAVLGREGGMIKNMYLPFFLGIGGRIGSGKQYLPWIHINDLTRMIKFAIENDNVEGIINGVAPQVITNNEFTQSFAKALRRPALFPVPEFVLNQLLNPERAMIMTKGQHVKPKRVLEYGFQYKYGNIDDACKECVN